MASLMERQLQLARELQAMSTTCYICHQSEQRKRCEILTDASKCKRDICVDCFKTHKNDSCMICAQKIEDHYKKGKMFQRSATFDEASKMYNREFKIRSNEEFQSLDFDLINLMAYYNAHPQVSVRKKYEEVEKEIKKILENKRKDQRTIISESQRIKQAKVFDKTLDPHHSGIESCGYNRRYDKGINLLRVGWGYPALTPQQFAQNADLMRKQRADVDEQLRQKQLHQLKLTKKRSDYEREKQLDSKIVGLMIE